MANTPPADTLRDGNIKASIWENQSDNGPFYTTTFSKTFRDADGNVRDTNGFNKGDLLRLAELARASYSRTGQLQREAAHDGKTYDQQIEDRVSKLRSQRQNRQQDHEQSL